MKKYPNGAKVEVTPLLYWLCTRSKRILHSTGNRARRAADADVRAYKKEYVKEYEGKYYIVWE